MFGDGALRSGPNTIGSTVHIERRETMLHTVVDKIVDAQVDDGIDKLLDSGIAIGLVALIALSGYIGIVAWTRWDLSRSAESAPSHADTDPVSRLHFLTNMRNLIVGISALAVTVLSAFALTTGPWRVCLSLIAIIAIGGIAQPLTMTNPDGSQKRLKREFTYRGLFLAAMMTVSLGVYFV